MTLATDWHAGLLQAIHDFQETRRRPPVVKVTLDPAGEEFYVQNAVAGPGDELVSLSAYPPGRDREMVEPEGGEFHTRRVVIVHPARVAKLELLYDAPNAQSFGFQAPTQ